MDEEQGNVIDVTARARQWRGSRPSPSPEADGDEARASAPKSLASSLLVPAEMLDSRVATPPGEHASPRDATAVAAGGASAETGDISGGGERNLFRAPDAAIIDKPVQRPKGITGMLRSVREEVARRRGVLRLPARRTIQLSHPRRLAVALALVAVVAAVAGLVTQPQTPSRTSTRAGGGPAAIAELGGLKGAFLASIARALGEAQAAGPSHPAHAGSAHRPGHKPAIAHEVLATPASTPISSSYTPTPTTTSRPPNSGGTTSNGTAAGPANGAQSPRCPPASTSGGSTTAFGSSGVLGPGSSPNG